MMPNRCFAWATGVPNRVAAHHHFFLAADLVVLPSFSDLSTDLMTPTATVWRMSRTAKRPSGGYSANDSTHSGFVGSSVTMHASPVFTNFGFSSSTLPDRLSIFWSMFLNLPATWAVWQSRTGE